MDLIVQCDGCIRCVYGEEVDLSALGRLQIARGSHVEPDEQGRWLVDLSPVRGPVLGPFAKRSNALQAETEWLAKHWLLQDCELATNTNPTRDAYGKPR